MRLIDRLTKTATTIAQLEDQQKIIVAEGPPLVSTFVSTGTNRTMHLPEVINQRVLDVKKISRLRHIFAFPDVAISKNTKHFGHIRRGIRGVAVCRPPHVIVSAARTFAVFTDQYLIVPPRQIGIVSTDDDVDFLKALSLYLSSDFALYHQFFTSTEFGVKRDRATLNALRGLPIPIWCYSRQQLKPWVDLHARLIKTSPVDVRMTRLDRSRKEKKLFDNDEEDLDALLRELNGLVDDSLGLDDRERALVHDLVRVRLELNDGKIGQPAVRQPKPEELKAYGRRLKKDLDAFIGGESEQRHQVSIVFDDGSASGMIQVDLISDKIAARDVLVVTADKPTATQLEATRKRLREQHHQWVYFDRNLRIYEGTRTFVFKPLQRFHWTASQAMQDASEIIAETLQLGGSGS